MVNHQPSPREKYLIKQIVRLKKLENVETWLLRFGYLFFSINIFLNIINKFEKIFDDIELVYIIFCVFGFFVIILSIMEFIKSEVRNGIYLLYPKGNFKIINKPIPFIIFLVNIGALPLYYLYPKLSWILIIISIIVIEKYHKKNKTEYKKFHPLKNN